MCFIEFNVEMGNSFPNLFEHAWELLNLIEHGVVTEGNRKMSPDFWWPLYINTFRPQHQF